MSEVSNQTYLIQPVPLYVVSNCYENIFKECQS